MPLKITMSKAVSTMEEPAPHCGYGCTAPKEAIRAIADLTPITRQGTDRLDIEMARAALPELSGRGEGPATCIRFPGR